MATTWTAAVAAVGTGDAISSVVAAVFFVVPHSSTDGTTTTDADVDPSRVFKNDGMVTLPLWFAAGGDKRQHGRGRRILHWRGDDDDGRRRRDGRQFLAPARVRVRDDRDMAFAHGHLVVVCAISVHRVTVQGRPTTCNARRCWMIAPDAQSSVEFRSHRIEDEAAAAPTSQARPRMGVTLKFQTSILQSKCFLTKREM
jgi:hypothetical protein